MKRKRKSVATKLRETRQALKEARQDVVESHERGVELQRKFADANGKIAQLNTKLDELNKRCAFETSLRDRAEMQLHKLEAVCKSLEADNQRLRFPQTETVVTHALSQLETACRQAIEMIARVHLPKSNG